MFELLCYVSIIQHFKFFGKDTNRYKSFSQSSYCKSIFPMISAY